jgi:membrane protease subunit HflC
MQPKITTYAISAIAALIILSNSIFIVDQTKQALVFQFGEVVRSESNPGMHIKVPFMQDVVYFDKRILNLAAEEKEVIAKDQKRLIVNAFGKYRITDPLKFYQTVRDENGIKSRLNSVLDSSLRQIIGEVPLSTLLTDQRAVLMKRIQQLVNNQAAGFGTTVIDVRIMRADLPKENSESIFKRMQTDREKEAKEFRAEGSEEAQRIKSRADRESKVILAEAQKKAQIVRGEGDAIANKIFASSFNKDPEFFAFYRSMQAYKNSLNSKDTTLILSPNSEFLKFLN